MRTSWNEAKEFADACRAIMTPLSSAPASCGSISHLAAVLHGLQILMDTRYSSDVPQISPLAPYWRSVSFSDSLSACLCPSEHNPLARFIPSPNMFIIINDCTKCPALALHISIWHMAVISIQKTCFFSDAENKTSSLGSKVDCQMNENSSMSAWTKS